MNRLTSKAQGRGAAVAALALASASAYGNGNGIADYAIVNGAIPVPLTSETPDPRRGRDIVLDIRRGNCLICHTVPNEPEEHFQGDLGPPLAGVAQRLSPEHMRLRMVDSTQINPRTVMPAYHRVANLNRVAEEYRGRPALSALEIEDVIAYLQTLDSPQ